MPDETVSENGHKKGWSLIQKEEISCWKKYC